MNDYLLKELFSDIIKGSSFFILDSLPVYIKHFSLKDASEVEVYQNIFFEEGRKQGLLYEKDAELKAINQKRWTQENKKQLESSRERLVVAEASLKEIRNLNERNLIEIEIKNLKETINKLSREKEDVLGFTLEKFVSQKIDNYYIFAALYNDSGLKERRYRTEEFDELTNEEIKDLIVNYNKKIKNFTSANIKKIALFPNFSNLFFISNDNPQIFYGRPIVDLSFYQAELFQYGKYYKSLLSNVEAVPPEDIRYDPEKLEEWYEFSVGVKQTQQKLTKNKNADGVGIIGDTKSLEKAGVDTGGIDLGAALKKNGGNMNMIEFMKLHKK